MDLQTQVERMLGASVSRPELDRAELAARRKLEGIITREGDLNGLRRESWYLAELIAEMIDIRRFSSVLALRQKEKPVA